MRVSKREHILDTGLAIIEREGLTALTFEALAAESGVTKGGLLYHFPSREALIEAIHRHVAEQWSAAVRAAAGDREVERLDDRERVEAYLRSTTEATRAELLLMLEAADNRSLHRVWQEVLDRWAPSTDEGTDDAGVRRLIVQLAADGLWLHAAIGGEPLSEELRARVDHELAALLDQ
ncbi:TetR/AcrR family transcriptional regulator [Aeromicrobium piscarium]|uniref:TetR family transcriptional regulator n=1 Tax=Aeromicrobium piscarium TaxID=2590901 RepID=A0A554RWZ8_9ACTN|nr:TetR family transcriptional regulator [Aeromicrobium piscarium]TSD58604.1 TetR family transcriptional regulator [Aeromicrobium piscarium]